MIRWVVVVLAVGAAGAETSSWAQAAAPDSALAQLLRSAGSAESVSVPAARAPVFRAQEDEPPASAALKPGDWTAYLEYLDAAAGTRSSGRNSIRFLVDKQALAPVLEAVSAARESIHVEVFQLQADQTGWEFARSLTAKAGAGVRVRLLLDAFGSNTSDPGVVKIVDFLRSSGVNVLIRPAPILDGHLDHRKVIVIDGTVGVTGGMNIGDLYQEEWHDQQCLLRGPAVAKLQEAFLSQWKAAGGAVGAGENLFPSAADQPDGYETRVLEHLGGDHDRNIKKAYLGAFATARSLIRIADPYFVDADIIRALEAASRRGVKVQVELPGINDVKIVQGASRAYYPDLLEAGVELYEYPERMAHEKVAIVDDYWTTFGSSNLDARSLVDNDELNVVVTDARFAAAVESALFAPDFAQSRRVTSYTPTLAERAERAASGFLIQSDGGSWAGR